MIGGAPSLGGPPSAAPLHLASAMADGALGPSHFKNCIDTSMGCKNVFGGCADGLWMCLCRWGLGEQGDLSRQARRYPSPPAGAVGAPPHTRPVALGCSYGAQ